MEYKNGLVSNYHRLMAHVTCQSPHEQYEKCMLCFMRKFDMDLTSPVKISAVFYLFMQTAAAFFDCKP